MSQHQLVAHLSNDPMAGPSIVITETGDYTVIEKINPGYDVTAEDALAKAGYQLTPSYAHLAYRLYATMREVEAGTVPVVAIDQ